MRYLLSLIIAGFGLTAFGQSSKPNVLIIMADDLGYSDLGCYGSEIRTPNLDALAKGGLRYTQFYNTARCWPSRSSILTGYYAQEIRRDALPGIKSGNQGTRPAWAKLLPDMLKASGYRSYHSGKWHVDGQPLKNGFDHSYVLDDHDRNFTPKRHSEDGLALPPVEAKDGYYTSTAIASHAIKCLKEHAEKYADQPFFEYLAFTSPHFPVQAKAEDIARYKETYKVGWDAIRQSRWERMKTLGIGGKTLSAIERDIGPPYAKVSEEALKKLGSVEVDRPIPWQDLTPEQREFQARKMAIHAAMVDRMDQEIGRVIEQLKAMKQFENTLIVFLSDNGASAEIMVRGDGHDAKAEMGAEGTFLCIGPGWSSAANTPFRRHKSWVHEGGISTPCIVHWPAGIAAKNELRHTPGHLVDVVPTVLALAKSQYKFEIPTAGQSLVETFQKDLQVRGDLWWLHEGNRAIRMGDWKLVAAKDQPWELYNLREDRAETSNLASQDFGRVQKMTAAWEKKYAEITAQAKVDSRK
ncbi:MAG: arylsulfatase [Fimbriiglobus sp.]